MSSPRSSTSSSTRTSLDTALEESTKLLLPFDDDEEMDGATDVRKRWGGSKNGLLARFAGTTVGSYRMQNTLLVVATLCIFLAGLALGLILAPRPSPPPRPFLYSNETFAALTSREALPELVANNLALSYGECDVGFPKLFEEVARTRAAFAEREVEGKKVAGISLGDLDRAEEEQGTRVAVINGQVFVKAFRPIYTRRVQAVIASLNEAVSTSPEIMPDVEFVFIATDAAPPGAHFGLNKEASQAMWLLPDFAMWSWPEPRVLGWADARRKAIAVDAATPWSKKEGRLFFRGAFLSDLRHQLADLARQFPWGDVAEIDWASGKNRVNMEDHCLHRYLANSEGWAAYSGRLKYTLLCRSVSISHAFQWTQHFHGAFNADSDSPDQNIVVLPEPRNWDALPGTMERLEKDQRWAQKIADNAVRTLRGRYLTPAATTCYWRHVLREYAALQQFTPSRGDGVDYASFMLMGEVHWNPAR